MGENVGQVLSALECILRRFCTLCSSGTCLAQKAVACSDNRAPSQAEAPGDSRHIAWPWVLPRKQEWGGNGPAETPVPGRDGVTAEAAAVTSLAVLRALRDSLAPLSGSEMNKVPASVILCPFHILCNNRLASVEYPVGLIIFSLLPLNREG